MAAFHDHEAGNNLDVSVEDDHLIAGAFDYSKDVESPFMESPFQNLDADPEELDIPHFVGDLRALMVDDSEDEVVLDSDDEAISEQKERKIRGRLWRRAQLFDVLSSAGSNLTEKVTDNAPSERSLERNLVSNDENKIGSREVNMFVNLNASFDNLKNENVVVNESQKPGESSEADALDFVDHFLSVSGVNSSPEVKISKFNGPKIKSPFSSCAKGSQKLAMQTSYMTKIGVTTFDWDSDQPDHGGEFFLEKKTDLDIQRDKHLGKRFKEGLQESSKQLSGNDSNERDAPLDMFDVGLDTQMAAEAMEALLYATPPRINANECEGLKSHFSFSLSANCDSQTNGISFKQKRVANHSHRMSTSFHKHSKNQKELHIESPDVGKKENCLNGDSLAEPMKKVYEKPLKVYRRKKQKQDSDKENIQGGLVKPGKKVRTFSHVASRTRCGSSAKHSKRTKDAKCNQDFVIRGNQGEGDVLHKRNFW